MSPPFADDVSRGVPGRQEGRTRERVARRKFALGVGARLFRSRWRRTRDLPVGPSKSDHDVVNHERKDYWFPRSESRTAPSWRTTAAMAARSFGLAGRSYVTRTWLLWRRMLSAISLPYSGRSVARRVLPLMFSKRPPDIFATLIPRSTWPPPLAPPCPPTVRMTCVVMPFSKTF